MKLHKIRFFISTILVCTVVFFSVTYSKNNDELNKQALKFKADGTFKIVQFADIQDGPDIDPRTISLMNKILDFENPDLVVLTGDNIDSRSKTVSDVRKAIDNIAGPMEKRRIPWAIVFGNHDEEHGNMSKTDMMKTYIAYPYNISQIGFNSLNRVGNYNLIINSSTSETPIFNIYMLDSGGYSELSKEYDYIYPNQIAWYKKTSSELRHKFNKIIPSLMFFHIPLPEFKEAWESGTAVGQRNEEECSPKINSGLFDELVRTGDVKGVFVGHDHINDYVGELKGIKLGYSRSIGYGTYGKEGFSRGARVFLIRESNPSKIETWMRLETDF
jgi:hypothetical protein